MAEISIRVCAAKAALQTMPAGTATAQEEKTHSSLSFRRNKVQCSETDPKCNIWAVQLHLLCVTWHGESRQPQQLLPAARVPSAVTSRGPGLGRVPHPPAVPAWLCLASLFLWHLFLKCQSWPWVSCSSCLWTFALHTGCCVRSSALSGSPCACQLLWDFPAELTVAVLSMIPEWHPSSKASLGPYFPTR